MSSAVPEGWSEPRLDEVVTKFQNGYAFSAKGYVTEGIPIISMGSIQLDGMFKKDNSKIKYWDKNSRDELFRYIVKSDDLIMAMTDVTPTMELIGRSCIVKGDREFFLNQRVGLISIDVGKVSKPFLSYLTNFDEWRAYCKGASGLGAQANLGTSQILDGQVLLPPLHEQRKIATILSSVDNVIEKTTAQIDKLKDLKTGMMQELLTKGIGHTEFKDSPVGRIPVGWDVVKLDSLCTKITDGEHQTPKRTSDGYFLLSARNIRDGHIALNDVDYVPQDEYDRISKRVLPEKGDILISCSGSIGRTAVVPENLKFSMVRSVAILQPMRDVVDSQFMAYQISSTLVQSQIGKSLSQLAQANLFQAPIKALDVLVPDMAEQCEISDAIGSVDTDIRVKSKKVDSLKNAKKALMQDLLTGKVRVSVN